MIGLLRIFAASVIKISGGSGVVRHFTFFVIFVSIALFGINAADTVTHESLHASITDKYGVKSDIVYGFLWQSGSFKADSSDWKSLSVSEQMQIVQSENMVDIVGYFSAPILLLLTLLCSACVFNYLLNCEKVGE